MDELKTAQTILLMFKDNIQVQQKEYVAINHEFVIIQIDKTLEQLDRAILKLKKINNIENIRKSGKFGKLGN